MKAKAKKRMTHDEQLAVDRDAKYQALQDIGRGAAESVAEMVAALECDYDRLEELRELKQDTERQAKENPAEPASMDDFDADELKELEKAAGECKSREDAETRIQQDPLSVEVRGDWHTIGDQENLNEPVEFRILLGTGGPATRIRGELQNGEPHRAWVEAQDWGTPWTQYLGDAVSQDDLLTYCRCFYFGE